MLTVYGTPGTRSSRVTWTLEELGLDYQFKKIDLRAGEGQRPPFIDLNPGGKVPVLTDGDLVLTESVAICCYLADLKPEAGLIPPLTDPAARATHLQWCCFAISELEQPLWSMAKHTFALPEDKRIAAMLATAGWEFRRPVKVLTTALQDREYILGDRFSVADILLGHTLAWARMVKLPLGDVLDGYADRLLTRPALAQAQAREQQN